MTRKNRKPGRPQAAKRVWVEPVQRGEIDQRKLARAALRLAMQQTERGDTEEMKRAYTKGDRLNGKESS